MLSSKDEWLNQLKHSEEGCMAWTYTSLPQTVSPQPTLQGCTTPWRAPVQWGSASRKTGRLSEKTSITLKEYPYSQELPYMNEKLGGWGPGKEATKRVHNSILHAVFHSQQLPGCVCFNFPWALYILCIFMETISANVKLTQRNFLWMELHKLQNPEYT